MSLSVVIGASGGIGGAMAEQLIGRGPVLALARRPPNPAPGIEIGRLDLLDEASIADAAGQASEMIQRLGVSLARVVIATGVLHSGRRPERSWRELDEGHLLRDFRINCVGPALVAKHFLPLVDRDQPFVLAALSARVGSISDNRLGGWHAYRASKAALNQILRTLAVEAARTLPQGVIVGLHPGTVNTPLSQPFQRSVAPEKLFTPAFAAERLIAVMDRLTPERSGGCYAWDGQPIPA
ncbi:SDR family NAD(P)-dependent oxidoreductase [Brevundimonas sp. 2R-24]|uniref:SDR family NAD(P)-dependent oxidoreductase n=1 Tax=Peiella sedimenti TaxID=3061083 RepID=A0ABT8SRV8_9CAUL|nr:SDR family NAD(P)-dependent oxidoreductase [Caulobacteraceae bacterium XZ-24]